MKAAGTFTGVVINVHIHVGNAELPLVRNNEKWSGDADVNDAPIMIVKMRFVAPEFTDWALELKLAGATAVKDEGTSDRQEMKKAWEVTRNPQGILAARDVTREVWHA